MDVTVNTVDTAGPGEIKRREVSWTLKKKLAQKRSRAKSWAIERESWAYFPSVVSKRRATDIVFVTLFCIAVGTAIAWCGGRCAMPDGRCLN